MFIDLQKDIKDITTNDLRLYLATYQNKKNSSKVTIDNIRRIFSSFFSWLEDEDYILKSPVRRIHKVRTNTLVKEVISDENLEMLRDSCSEIRDLAMIDLLASTGMRVGELVKINRLDIDFHVLYLSFYFVSLRYMLQFEYKSNVFYFSNKRKETLISYRNPFPIPSPTKPQ